MLRRYRRVRLEIIKYSSYVIDFVSLAEIVDCRARIQLTVEVQTVEQEFESLTTTSEAMSYTALELLLR